MSSSTTFRFPFQGSSRRRRTMVLFCSEDILLLSSALVPHGDAASEGWDRSCSQEELRDMRSEGRGARVHASGVGSRLLAAASHATGDQLLHEQRVETVQG